MTAAFDIVTAEFGNKPDFCHNQPKLVVMLKGNMKLSKVC